MTEQSHSPTGATGDASDLPAALRHSAELLRAFWCDGDGTSLHTHSAYLMEKAASAIATLSPNGVSQSAVERRVKVAILAELMRVEPDAIARELTDEEIGNIARAALSAMPEHQSKESRSCE